MNKIIVTAENEGMVRPSMLKFLKERSFYFKIIDQDKFFPTFNEIIQFEIYLVHEILNNDENNSLWNLWYIGRDGISISQNQKEIIFIPMSSIGIIRQV